MKSLRPYPSPLSLLPVIGVVFAATGCHSGGTAPSPAAQQPVAAKSAGATPTAVIKTSAETGDATPVASIPAQPPRIDYGIVHQFPHDPTAFTEGLLWHDGYLYEGTGLERQSYVRQVELETGKVVRQIKNAPEYFGEGLALAGDRLVQLTWQTHKGFVYDLESFKQIDSFTYPTEGWGLTYDGTSLVMSDGTSTITFLDPKTFKPTRKIQVTFGGTPLKYINELEWIDGEIWANVWQTDQVVRIDPKTGAIKSYIDFTGLLPQKDRTGREDVLNGIAYDPQKKRIFVTGKNWPKLYEIKLYKN